jgi:gliding motility-associated-like protein
VYDEPGAFPVTLTASFLQCSETASSQVFVFKEPTIAFGMVEGLQCEPYPAYFVDSSSSDTPLTYLWNFGDGCTSTEQNPMHLYTEPGQYTVTLQITTTAGCTAVLTLTKPGMITVHPTPVSDFDVTPQSTDICHSSITFIDHSEGALWYYYIFDDEGAVSQESSPHYTYLTDGTHNPMQIVINEFQCRDTSYQSIFVEPFMIYIPNTFTPDGDEFNNYFHAATALDSEEWEMRIYNRWGELVYQTTDQYGEWDGTFKGLLAAEGMYSYKVKYISCAPGSRWEELTGHFSLLR